MKLCSSAQMREIDRHVIEDLGVPGAMLMSNAAAHIAAAALEGLSPGGRAAVLCGTGNNGGDGIGAAAFMIDKGIHVRVFLLGSEERLTPDSREMLQRLTASGGKIEKFCESGEIEGYLSRCDVIIDAIFGTGLNSDLRGDALPAVKMMNSSGARIIAADIPSGVSADTGLIMGDSVNADITVTFSLAKPGHFIEPGCTRRGELRISDIGIPDDILDSVDSGVFAVMPEDIALKPRRLDTHKGDYGRCLVAAGSVGYSGAPAFCARAASKMGAGLVFLGVPDQIYGIMATKLDEEMPFPLPGDTNGRLAANAAGELIRRAEGCDAFLIGPGLGRSDEISEMVASLIRIIRTPIILDADGLFAISDNVDVLGKAVCPMILTPHLGEFSRLTGGAPYTDRLSAARGFAVENRCTLVLKGHRTITALPDGTAFINVTGGPAMAKGGSGDVLAGMITALIGQRYTIKDAALIAVYLHGLAGDMCAAEYGEYSVTAGDIIAMLPKAIMKLGERAES